MADEDTRTCFECDGKMSPIIMMDKSHPGLTRHRHTGQLEYRLPDDRLSFWSARFPTAGLVRAYLCADCGRIALYGIAQDSGEAENSGTEAGEDDDQSEV
jgi:hypothetical protein